MSNPKIPNDVEEILSEFISRFNQQFPDTLEGIYVHGSLALNAYIPKSSDIDLIVLVNRTLLENDIAQLAPIHRMIAKKYKTPILDGCYLLPGDLEQQAGTHHRLYFNDGKVHCRSLVYDPISAWILKEKGICVTGPAISSFHLKTDPKQLIEFVISNMNSYWANRIKRNERLEKYALLFPEKLIHWDTQWSVLGMLRQYYTLREKDIISKLDAGRYALDYMPEEWHSLIHEAIRIREGKKRGKFNKKRNYSAL